VSNPRVTASAIQRHLNAACQAPSGVLREQYHAFDHRMFFRYDLPRSLHVTFRIPMEHLELDPRELTRRYLDPVVEEARKLLAA
jgi:hypothetical protein